MKELVLRAILGSLLCWAGATKVGNPVVFASLIQDYQLLPSSLVTLTAVVLPILEIIVGFCLLVGLATQGAALLATCLFCGFVVGVTSAIVRGLNIECGCFSDGSMVSWGQVSLDLLLLLLAIFLVYRGGGAWSLDHRIYLRTVDR